MQAEARIDLEVKTIVNSTIESQGSLDAKHTKFDCMFTI